VRWLDLHFEEYGLVVEIDGLWHMEVSAWWADLRRLNEHTLHGDSLLRFPAFAVRDDPAAVARIVGAALRRLGWRPMSIGAVIATHSDMTL
jgi:very-short-patch-repair endonuclease